MQEVKGLTDKSGSQQLASEQRGADISEWP